MASEERDTRIPYRLGTDQYCKFKDIDEYVHIGDFVVVKGYKIFGKTRDYCGKLSMVGYDSEGFLRFARLLYPNEIDGYYVSFDGAFRCEEVVEDV